MGSFTVSGTVSPLKYRTVRTAKCPVGPDVYRKIKTDERHFDSKDELAFKYAFNTHTFNNDAINAPFTYPHRIGPSVSQINYDPKMKRIWVWTKEKRIYYYDVKFHVLPQKIIEKIPVDPDDLQNKVTDSKDAESEIKAAVIDEKVEEPKPEKPKSPEPKSTASESPIPEAISEPVAVSDESKKVEDLVGDKDESEPVVADTGTTEDAEDLAATETTEDAQADHGDGEVEAEAEKGIETDTEPGTDNEEVEKSENENVEKHEIISEGLLEIEITEV